MISLPDVEKDLLAIELIGILIGLTMLFFALAFFVSAIAQ